MTGYGRVLRVDDAEVHVATTLGVRAIAAPSFPVGAGDLVRLEHGSVLRLVARNRSPAPLDKQDFWRIMQVLPALKRRHRILADVRRWFDDREFLEVETPLATAGPGTETHLEAVQVRIRGERRYLVTSPEYHMKRLLSAGVERLFYLGRAFRDNERGAHHHPEFTMLEWYRTGEGPEALMQDVEELVELATGTPRRWTRVTVREALARWGSQPPPDDPDEQDPDETVRQLVEHVEPAIAGLGAVFLTEYPASLASLARLSQSDPTVSERFEAYVDGVELANGFGELTDHVEQRRRIEHDLARRRALGLLEYPMDERFLDALAAGLPPCAGIALGVDRLVMLALGATSLDDVVAFPPEIA